VLSEYSTGSVDASGFLLVSFGGLGGFESSGSPVGPLETSCLKFVDGMDDFVADSDEEACGDVDGDHG
jgi:hypothetical protein